MASNASRGAAAKAKTKRWLSERGYQVGNLEDIYWIFNPKDGRMIPRKKDQFGCDLIAISKERVIFVQVKSGQTARGGTFPAARREFAKFVWPENTLVQRAIIAWPPRARVPRLIVVSGVWSQDFREVTFTESES